ncbi:hypothetical protein [Streptomyces sp. NBC_00198]|uniref:hypothetical protein n=1 Tax=Streptomyces sp. NBC_00198 TaxID=2975677 RepID=UPI0022557243|nr:hypothetical protein [Streptomyces sp. NBC_00198]MCX5285964.1 hypothetical protein [Streptomyces sp. NBC_00198]MCX5286273.1 hypothetical protein [Streptomyces sp. NBC_00198]
MNATTRPDTPDVVTYDEQGRKSTRISTKRACNGCGALLGDLTDDEFTAGINGRPLPDVRQECPTCGPSAPPPECRPMKLLSGEVRCLEGDCPHGRINGDRECPATRIETVCAIHSTFTPGFEDAYEEATHAEPWPCQYNGAQSPADGAGDVDPRNPATPEQQGNDHARP